MSGNYKAVCNAPKAGHWGVPHAVAETSHNSLFTYRGTDRQAVAKLSASMYLWTYLHLHLYLQLQSAREVFFTLRYASARSEREVLIESESKCGRARAWSR